VLLVDTTVLVYAVGAYDALREPCRWLLSHVASRRIEATTTVEVIHRFVGIRAARWGGGDAVALGRAYLDLLSPLAVVTEDHLGTALTLYDDHAGLLPAEAVLAAVAAARDATLVSADRTYATLGRPRWVHPGDAGLVDLLRPPNGPTGPNGA
jgi:hypothetical protein